MSYTGKTKQELVAAYKNMLKKMGYTIMTDYSGRDGFEDSMSFLLFEKNVDNPKENYYIFYSIILPDAPCGLNTFELDVFQNNNIGDFMQKVKARVRVCRISKSEVISGLIHYGWKIDDIYIHNMKTGRFQLKIPNRAIPLLSSWVNTMGGENPRKRGEPEKR